MFPGPSSKLSARAISQPSVENIKIDNQSGVGPTISQLSVCSPIAYLHGLVILGPICREGLLELLPHDEVKVLQLAPERGLATNLHYLLASIYLR